MEVEEEGINVRWWNEIFSNDVKWSQETRGLDEPRGGLECGVYLISERPWRRVKLAKEIRKYLGPSVSLCIRAAGITRGVDSRGTFTALALREEGETPPRF